MKLGVSLSAADVALLDEYARTSGLPSRSAALQHGVRLLRHADLEEDYASAWQDWESSGEQHAMGDIGRRRARRCGAVTYD